MARFNIEDVAFSGVGLLARAPVAALVWAALYSVMAAVVTLPFAGPLTQLVTTAARPLGPDPAVVVSLMPALGAWWILLALCGLVIGAVISCAVFRAVLRPGESDFAYLRLGDQEIAVMLVNFVRGVMIFGINMGLSIIVLVLMSVVTTIAGPAGGSTVRVIGQIVISLVVFWIGLRLSLAGPMTFTEGKFRLIESWTLTRGLSLPVVAVGVILLVIGVVVILAVGTLAVFASVSIWNSEPGLVDLHALLSQPPSQWMGAMAPFIGIFLVSILITSAIMTPVGLAPWPNLYRLLAGAGDSDETI